MRGVGWWVFGSLRTCAWHRSGCEGLDGVQDRRYSCRVECCIASCTSSYNTSTKRALLASQTTASAESVQNRTPQTSSPDLRQHRTRSDPTPRSSGRKLPYCCMGESSCMPTASTMTRAPHLHQESHHHSPDRPTRVKPTIQLPTNDPSPPHPPSPSPTQAIYVQVVRYTTAIPPASQPTNPTTKPSPQIR